MVLISKQERRLVYSYLLQEGTIVVKLDPALPRHQDINVQNLKVMMICKSLKSKGLLGKTYNWQYLYYCLTSDGIKAMCEYLGLPPTIKPEIYKKPPSQRLFEQNRRPGGMRGRGGFGRGAGFRRQQQTEQPVEAQVNGFE